MQQCHDGVRYSAVPLHPSIHCIRTLHVLWDYVEPHIPAVLEHTGTSAFDEHLKGVQAVLRYWNAPPHLMSAGLFHSIYWTEGFQGFSLPLTECSAIQDIVGMQAEKLCWIFAWWIDILLMHLYLRGMELLPRIQPTRFDCNQNLDGSTSF